MKVEKSLAFDYALLTACLLYCIVLYCIVSHRQTQDVKSSLMHCHKAQVEFYYFYYY